MSGDDCTSTRNKQVFNEHALNNLCEDLDWKLVRRPQDIGSGRASREDSNHVQDQCQLRCIEKNVGLLTKQGLIDRYLVGNKRKML